MSKFLRHDPCPQCGSKDNLSIWDDGHKWCFGCGYYIPPHGIEYGAVKKRLSVPQKETEEATVTLPTDCSEAFSPIAKNWLTANGIFTPDIIKYRIKWSQSNGAIILPIYDDDNKLVMYQMRYLDRKPKYLTRGNLGNHLPVFSNDSTVNLINTNTVVVVEDFISAVKVGYHLHTMPLFGSHFHLNKMKALSVMYNNLLIWLDPDKFDAAIKFAQQAAVVFDKVKVIRSTNDPKEYAHYEVGNKLRSSLESMKQET